MDNQIIPFDHLSEFTSFPNDQEADYEEYFDDPQLQAPIYNNGSDPMFTHNLAMHIDEMEMSTVGQRLTDLIEKDRQDRAPYISILEEGIDYLGIGNTKIRNSNSTRHTDIVSLSMMTIGLRVASKIHSTLFPPGDFVDSTIRGKQRPEIVDQADRIKAYSNYFLRDVAEEYVPDKKQGIWWMVFEGSIFTKIFYDPTLKRPVLPYVRSENIIINSDAPTLEMAERVTHEFYLSEREYLDRVKAKQYRMAYLEPADINDDKTRARVQQKIGINTTQDDISKVYCLNEILVYEDAKGFEHLDKDGQPSGRKLPFIITKDRHTNTIVGWYRNWEEHDPEFKKINYFVQHKYSSGTTIYGFGLFHYLLGYAKAETELQQQLLKAAQLSNAPVLLMNAGIRSETSQLDIAPGRINQFNSFGADFNSNTKPLGFTPPQPITLELKTQLGQKMEEVGIAQQITPDKIPVNMAGVTMIGMLSTMNIVEDSLMNDLFISFKKELRILYSLFAKWLPNQPYPFAVEGDEHVIMSSDFAPTISIRPTMDPNVSNSTLQLIINDTLNNLAKEAPNLYNLKEIHKRLLKTMKVGDIDSLMVEEKAPPPLDPISEGKVALTGQPIKAYKWQNQDAYITIHQDMVNSLQQDQTSDHTQTVNILLSNITERQAFKYLSEMEARIGQSLPEDPSQLHPEEQNQIAMIAAQAILQKQQQDQVANPPPKDPTDVLEHEVAVKEKQVELQAVNDERKATLEQEKHSLQRELQEFKREIELERMQLERESMASENQFRMFKIESEEKINNLQIALEKAKINLDNQTKAYASTLQFEKGLDMAEEKNHDNLDKSL